MPNVKVETRTQGNIVTTIYDTPVGSVSTKERKHLGRISDTGSVQIEWMTKDVADYDVVIYMIENTIFHRDDTTYYDLVRNLAADDIVRGGESSRPTTRLSVRFGFGLLKRVTLAFRNGLPSSTSTLMSSTSS